MSIDAFVIKPENEVTKKLYTPVMSQRFFQKCVMPAIDAENLNWLRGLSVGIDVNMGNLKSFSNELFKLKEWSKNNLNKEDYAYLNERISRLEAMLDKAFQLEEVTVFIG